jgi:hypothetical protein
MFLTHGPPSAPMNTPSEASSLSDYRAEMRKVVASLRRCETLRARRALCDASASAKKRQPWLVDDDGYIWFVYGLYMPCFCFFKCMFCIYIYGLRCIKNS